MIQSLRDPQLGPKTCMILFNRRVQVVLPIGQKNVRGETARAAAFCSQEGGESVASILIHRVQGKLSWKSAYISSAEERIGKCGKREVSPAVARRMNVVIAA